MRSPSGSIGCYSPQCSRSDASSSTGRRTERISSNCSGPAISGGESWITGSPRSSARQISPRLNISGERKPRSSHSSSSPVNVSLVSWSRTSSIERK